ncbi:MAG: hypothetical protein JJU36_07295 [Phycisphaeraceae bacterium]|nr:hypothetical protein [Phycisphaeraceae bacterium]
MDALALERLTRLSFCQLQALKSRWITTIDAFVAAAATVRGRAGLCSALDIEMDTLDEVLRDACDALGEQRYRDLLAARPGGPTGALLEDDHQLPADGSANRGESQ